MNCPIKLDEVHCPNCYFRKWGEPEDKQCHYWEVIKERKALADRIMTQNLNNAEGKLNGRI